MYKCKWYIFGTPSKKVREWGKEGCGIPPIPNRYRVKDTKRNILMKRRISSVSPEQDLLRTEAEAGWFREQGEVGSESREGLLVEQGGVVGRAGRGCWSSRDGLLVEQVVGFGCFWSRLAYSTRLKAKARVV